MKTPSLETVKEHFKNAKVVRSVYGTEFTMTKKLFETIHIFSDISYHVRKMRSPCIWQKSKGYAEIIEYKKPETEFPQDMKVWDDDKNKAEVREVKAYLEGEEYPYVTNHSVLNTYFTGYKNAEPLKKDISDWKAEDIKTVDDAIIQLEYATFSDKSRKAVQILSNHLKNK